MKTNGRTFKFNSILAATLIIVVVAAVLLNIIISNIVNAQIDLTPNKDFTMSEDAKQGIKDVNKEVQIVGLFDKIKQELNTPSQYETTYFTDMYVQGKLNKGSAEYTQYMSTYGSKLSQTTIANLSVPAIMSILEQFASINPNIKVSYVDPDSNTLFIKKFVPGDQASDFRKGDFIVKCGDIVKKVSSSDLCLTMVYPSSGTGPKYLPYGPNVDSAFLSAILYVSAEKRPVIGVVTNHGEDNIINSEPGDANNYTILKKSLESNGFQFTGTDIVRDESNLGNVDILLLLNPKSDITVTEEDILVNKYLMNGGNLIVAADPAQNSPGFSNLNVVLKDFNLKINNDLVGTKDTTQYNNEGFLLSITPYQPENLIDVLSSQYSVVIPKARSITYISTVNESIKTSDIIRTNDKAYVTDYTTGKEIAGAAAIGTISINTNDGGPKVMALGSASFLADKNSAVKNSTEAMIRICSWMKKYQKHFITPKVPVVNKITISESGVSIMGWISILLIPLVLFASGIYVWVRRRHL